MNRITLYELLCLVAQGIEQGLEGTYYQSSLLNLKVDEVSTVIPFQLLFQKGSGLFVATTGIPYRITPSINCNRISVQWRQQESE